MFEKLSEKPIAQVQNQQADQWDREDLLKQCIDKREGSPSFLFYEGPPTANGRPGIHHVMARTLKDSVCRYKTMKGYQVRRKAGWDTHGLPVEIEVEKQLQLSCKADIEEYGIDRFNRKCRESVFTYEKQWREMTRRMGYLIDLEHPYITLDNDYIESVWWILNRFFQEGFIYEGYKILPYCPRCGTGLASHEVALGYKEIKSNTATVKFKRKDAQEYFLAWTTTPWTLVSNAALTVGPDVDYIKARFEGEVYYVAKALADRVFKGEYEVLEQMKGKDLEYLEYEQLRPFLRPEPGKKAFIVTTADYVTIEDGTGIVHTAPAFGEDDYNTGRRYGLTVFNPVGEDGKYTDSPWKGRFVMDCDVDIIKWLAAEGKLFAKEKMAHNYPHCWRCSTPLLYYAKPSWYIEMTKIKERLIEQNNAVNWFPDFVGEKRFGNWLENLNDWAISRSRYWGTPLNIWRCECGHLESVGSRKELVEKAIEDIDQNIELHRPYVDDIHFTCPVCGKTMTRVPDVIDCWFDSGSMPFAQQHYPFENSESFDREMFPADFICEGIDQTRGWFYSLLAISCFVKGVAPYKNVLVNDLILDKEGKKMSKSKGNTVDPFDLFDKYGADATRWYLLQVSPAWSPTKFDEDGLIEVQGKFFGTLKNVYNFFVLYANTDQLDVRSLFDTWQKEGRPALAELDQWILSKFNRLVAEVTQEMDQYDHMRATRKIQQFVIEDLSNWYIRRARRRFYQEGMNPDKTAVYCTTYEVLVGVTKLIAPFAPFLSDEMYLKLAGGDSVHVQYYPQCQEGLINEKTEERMDLVRDLVGLGRGAREKEKLKVRQPLREILVDGKYEKVIGDLTDLIKEELNVKKVVFEKDLEKYMNFSLKPNFKTAGPVLGKKVKALGAALASCDPKEAVACMEEQGAMSLSLEGEMTQIPKDLVDVSISAKEGFVVAMENNLFTILDTTLDQELIHEGLAREFVSKVQQMRKAKGFEMMDHIAIAYQAEEEVCQAVEKYRKYIMEETLAERLEQGGQGEAYKLNGHESRIQVSRL